MSQKIEIYLKEMRIKENGHHSQDKNAANILLASWKQPNFIQEEIVSGAKMDLSDYDPEDPKTIATFKQMPKWRLFKATVENSSEIEFLLTGTVEISKFAKGFMKALAGVLGTTVGAIPIVGGKIADMMKDIEDKTSKIGAGILKVPKGGLSEGDHVIQMEAPETLKVLIDTGYKPTGTYISKKEWVKKVGKGESNGEIVVSVVVFN